MYQIIGSEASDSIGIVKTTFSDSVIVDWVST